MMIRKIAFIICFLTVIFETSIYAQDTKIDTTSLPGNKAIVHPAPGASDAAHNLAAASSNPLANMISLPLQNNFNFGYGADDQMQWTTNIMPVIPFKLNKKMNFINRVVIPVQNIPAGDDGTTYGIGNTTWSMWVVPAPLKINKGLHFVYGLGPALILPTASSPKLGGDAFGIGATFVGLFMTKHIVGGILLGAAASYKTDDLREFWAQYFFTWNIKNGWFINSSPTFGANFNAPDGQEWLVPLGAGFGKLVKFGKLPVKLNPQAFYNVVAPDGAATWNFQFSLTMLFPKKPK
jgi:hypothetical protein